LRQTGLRLAYPLSGTTPPLVGLSTLGGEARLDGKLGAYAHPGLCHALETRVAILEGCLLATIAVRTGRLGPTVGPAEAAPVTITETATGSTHRIGTFLVRAAGTTQRVVQGQADQVGLALGFYEAARPPLRALVSLLLAAKGTDPTADVFHAPVRKTMLVVLTLVEETAVSGADDDLRLACAPGVGRLTPIPGRRTG